MEVGAVKQAFNNEIIQLKKNLNQAKIQTIHKLTRKAKTLTEKKLPEPMKEKLKRKAESAVKEVLIIKKIKARDIARFIVTHTGKLNDYLNKPVVDNNKACARLLLHKALQHKYKHIREKFLDISIKDLFMSRQERRKLKKEAREKQKNKRKGKDKKDKTDAVNVEGEWDVEMTDDKNTPRNDTLASDGDLKLHNNKSGDEYDISDNESEKPDSDNEDDESDGSNEDDGDDSEDDGDDSEVDDESEAGESSESAESNEKVNGVKRKPVVLKANDSDIVSSDEESRLFTPKSRIESTQEVKKLNSDKGMNKDIDSTDIENNRGKTQLQKNNVYKKSDLINSNRAANKEDSSIINAINKKLDKKANSNKNKNLKNKLENRNFHKESDDTPNEVTKMVDPFFLTSTGENYMSLVEPRQPDEVKEVHRQGNRQYRRAVMFGHVPRVKPKRNFEPRNDNFKKKNSSEVDNNKFNKNNRNYDRKTSFNRKSDRSNNFKDDSVPEKLHPSWEAKKKQSSILPFQGKKIVFDES